MPLDSDSKRRLERALEDLRVVRSKEEGLGEIPVTVRSRTFDIEAAEKLTELIANEGGFKAEEADRFRKLANNAINEKLRGIAKGDEVSAAINITVTGTGTISTS